jgi:hypothetical protein
MAKKINVTQDPIPFVDTINKEGEAELLEDIAKANSEELFSRMNPILSKIWLNHYPDFHIGALRRNADFLDKYFVVHDLIVDSPFSGIYNVVSELRGCANFFETWKSVVEMNCHKLQKEKDLAVKSSKRKKPVKRKK